MAQTKLKSNSLAWAFFSKLVVVIVLLPAWRVPSSTAQEQGQKLFSSPEDASSAFVAAVRNNDLKAMIDILGPNGRLLVYSGDQTEDAQRRANFVQRYQEMHRLVKGPDGNVILYIGAKKLAHADPPREQGQFLVFRYRGE